MKRIASTLGLVAALVGAACSNGGDSAKPAASGAPVATGASKPPAVKGPTGPGPAAQQPQPQQPKQPAVKREGKPGEIPFDFPTVALSAKPGDFVLAPSRHFVDDAFNRGADQQTFIFYAANVVEPGAAESKLKTLAGKDETIPNSLIIPIKKGEKAKPGDVVLTWWQSGSGMQRSIVVAGGTDTEPKVRHLDLDLENPGGAALRDDPLKPDSFQKIDGDWAPGRTVAAKEPGGGYKYGIITTVAGDKVLAVGFAGRMKVYNKADLVQLPVAPAVKQGDTVFVPYLGTFYRGTVEKVDAPVGRVYTKFAFGSQTRTSGIPLPNVATSLPGM